MTKERPISFTWPMVRAIREGRKTMTRRLIRPQPDECKTKFPSMRVMVADYCTGVPRLGQAYYARIAGCWNNTEPFFCPYLPGDRFYVREEWAFVPWPPLNRPDLCRVGAGGVGVTWRERWEPKNPSGYRWKSPKQMPRWASRILVEVTASRPERVMDISIADIQREGLFASLSQDPADMADELRDKWRDLWNSLHAKRGFPYFGNPWVWAITFQPVEV